MSIFRPNLNQVLRIQYCHFGRENKCKGHFKRVVTFIMDSPARGTVRHIGEEVDSIGNVYIIVGLELVGNHNF